VDADGVAGLHDARVEVLSETGVIIGDPEALDKNPAGIHGKVI
jgi:hypothetical protein